MDNQEGGPPEDKNDIHNTNMTPLISTTGKKLENKILIIHVYVKQFWTTIGCME